jgi:hypothetical protein
MRWNRNWKTQPMQPHEITFFSVTLFLALAALLTWKHRRDAMHARLNKGLRGYVSHSGAPQGMEESPDEGLIVA